MSEKRFKLDFDNHSQGSIMDRQDKYGQYCRLYDFGEVGRQQIVDLLNEQQATIDKQDKAIREALKVLADSKNYQSVISFKYGLQYATKLLKRVIDDE